MWFINIGVCVLIVEFLCCVTAQADVQSFCTKNGGPEVNESITINSENIETCYQSRITEWKTEVQKSEIKGSTALALLCNKVDTLNYCVKRQMDIIRSYITAEPIKDENLLIVYNIKPLIFKFACENRKLLDEGLNSTDRECLASKLQAVETCAYKFLVSENATIFTDPSKYASDLLEILSQLKIGTDCQDCRRIQSFEQCSVEVEDQCEDQIFSKILHSLSNYIKNETPCKSLPKSLGSEIGSEASPGSVVNVLLSVISLIVMIY